MIRKAFLSLGLTLLTGSAAWAVPQSLNFQGLLKESGVPVNGTRSMTFDVIDVSSNVLYTETQSSVNLSSGIFNVTIGDQKTGGILGIMDGNDRYVRVTVGSTVLGAQKITSVGYAVFAATAATLPPGASIQIQFVSASSATLTATGATQYSLQTSSGINVQSGGVTAPFFSGTYYGNGSGLTGLSGTDSTKVLKTGDTMTGQLTISGSSVTASSAAFTQTGNTSYSIVTSSGISVSSGGVSAPFLFGAHYGDGSGLTGVTGTDNTKVLKAGDTMTGPLTLSGSTLTVTGSAFSVGGSTLVVRGGNVGIGTTSPATSFDANGSAQFGLGVAKSTFSATPSGTTYALYLSSGLSIAAGGIKWPDGSVSTTAATSGGSVATSVSTQGFWSNSLNTNQNLTNACVAGSTVSVVFTGTYPIDIWLSGFFSANNGGVNGALVLVDGAAPDSAFTCGNVAWIGGTAKLLIGVGSGIASGTGSVQASFSGYYRSVQTYSAGTHNICVVACDSNANASAGYDCRSGSCWGRYAQGQ